MLLLDIPRITRSEITAVHLQWTDDGSRSLFFFSLKHFGHFQPRHFGHWNISVICLTFVLKLAIKVFFTFSFKHSDRNGFTFFGHFKNVSVYEETWPKKQAGVTETSAEMSFTSFSLDDIFILTLGTFFWNKRSVKKTTRSKTVCWVVMPHLTRPHSFRSFGGGGF